MTRNSEQTASTVELTIAEIRSNSKASRDKVIKSTCKKNDISELHIRRVAGWKKEVVAVVPNVEPTP